MASQISLPRNSPPGPASKLGLARVLATLATLLLFSNAANAGRISLAWSDNSENEIGFEIERMDPSGDFAPIANVEENVEAFVDESAKPGLEYQYRVRAFNEYGYSGYTNVAMGSVANTPPALVDADSGEPLESQSISFQLGEGTAVYELRLTDAETAPEELIFEVLPTDTTVVPYESIEVTRSAGVATIAVDTRLCSIGTTDVSLLLSDGAMTTEAVLSLALTANQGPRVSLISAQNVFDGQSVGPIPFTIIDDTPAEKLVLTAESTNEALVPSENITIAGTGYQRNVFVDVPLNVTGRVILNIKIDDGFSVKTAPVTLNIAHDDPPGVAGIAKADYVLNSWEKLERVAFSVWDNDHGADNLKISIDSTNKLLFPPVLSKIKGTGTQREFDLVPAPRQSGTATVRVAVSDGIKTTYSESFTVTVLPAEVILNITSFQVMDRLAVAEVNKVDSAGYYQLQRSFTMAPLDWKNVEDAHVEEQGDRVVLIDPSPVASGVCYRVQLVR